MEIQIRSESSQTHNKPPSPRVTKTRSQVWFFRVCSCILVWTCLFQLFTGLTNQISRFSLPVEPVRLPPLLPPRRNYTSNGILRVSCNGGLNQMRAAICDMVTIARLLNLTLVVPELDKKSFWADPSDFEDVFDINHFIDSLRDEVRIIKRLPSKKHGYKLFQMPPVSWSNEKYYLHKLLPRFRKHKVIHFNRSDTRLANNGLSLHLQRLRCRVNFQGLRFTPRIEALGAKLVQILQQRGPFVALHLRYEMDMLAFSGCTHGCTEKEAEELRKMRYAYPWWKEKEIVSEERRVQGRCPLTPEEAVLVLKALGFQKDTQIYIAAGDIYGGERRLADAPRIIDPGQDDATMAEPDDSSTKDKPGWINGEDTDLKPADETEDELEPAEESMLELKPAEVIVDELDELSELRDTSLELNELSDTEDGAGLVAGRNEHFSAQRKIHNKFNLGRFYTKFDQTFPQSISSPFSSRMPRGSNQGSLGRAWEKEFNKNH